MKEAAEFLLDYLVDDGKGHLITGPSLSPENQYKLPDGTPRQALHGPRRWTRRSRTRSSRASINAAHLLGVDAEFQRRLAAALERLPTPRRSEARTVAGMARRLRRARPRPSPHLAPVRAAPGQSDHAARHAGAGAGRARHARAPARKPAAATRAGAAPGSSTSGRVSKRATSRTRTSSALLAKSTLPEPVRHSSAVSDRRQLRRHGRRWPRCSCRAMRASFNSCLRFRARGRRVRSGDSARVVPSRLI